MTHETIDKYKCPGCGGTMEKGFITGNATRLRWCLKEKTQIIFSGTPLKKKRDIWNAPTVEAVRCNKCKIGLFSYDN